MSPTLGHFGRAAEGSIPALATVSDISIMGSKPGNDALHILATQIGHGLETGHIDLTQAAIDAKAAHAVRATPGGGLSATGDETVRYKYNAEQNEALFSGRQADISIKAPQM